jgi:hypothetical protein
MNIKVVTSKSFKERDENKITDGENKKKIFKIMGIFSL